MATLTLTQGPRLPLASRRRPRRQDWTTATAAIWRVCSDVGLHWRENNWAGAKWLQSCAGQHDTSFNTQKSRTHGAKMSGRGGYEEKKWTLCDG